METNKFAQAMEREVAWKTTENGQPALNTTFDKCLDLFGTIGALRSRTEAEIKLKFSEAYREDPLTAVKILFYARDIELGLGERNTFKICLNWLADFATEDVILNLENVVKFGRWDDLYALDGTRAEKAAYDFMKEQFLKDCLDLKTENKPISLLGKWLKSVNTSSEESKALGKKTAKMFGLSEVNYRKCLSALRTRINVIEKLMSQNEWEKINFNHVGGNALKRYKEAFARHQEERYREYLEAVKENKTIAVDGKEEKAKMNVKKLMEEVVEQNVNELYDQLKETKPSWFSCDCNNCRIDTICYVLNRISPKYVVSGTGAVHSVQELSDSQLKADLDSVCLEGVKIVNSTKRPYHNQVKTNLAVTNTIPAFNFSIFTGTIMDGSNFEPIGDASILLKINGQPAEMVDSSWANPFTTRSSTKGSFSFMVKSIPAEKEGITKKFNFTIEVSAPSYGTSSFHFEVPVTSDGFTKTEIDSAFSLKLKDILIFKDFIENPME